MCVSNMNYLKASSLCSWGSLVLSDIWTPECWVLTDNCWSQHPLTRNILILSQCCPLIGGDWITWPDAGLWLVSGVTSNILSWSGCWTMESWKIFFNLSSGHRTRCWRAELSRAGTMQRKHETISNTFKQIQPKLWQQQQQQSVISNGSNEAGPS